MDRKIQVPISKEDAKSLRAGDYVYLTGTIYKYNFYVSRNGKEWTKCDTTGEFSNIMHNPVPYFVRFGKTYPARYFKLEPVAEINSKAATAVGEVGVLLK